MRIWFHLCLTIFAGFAANGQPKLQLLSPDKTIRVEIKASGRLSYSIFVDNKKILEESEIDMNLENGRSLSGDLKIIRKNSRSVHETIVAQVAVSRKYIPDEFDELTIEFASGFSIFFRAYNDGVAYRIKTSFPDSIVVLNEKALFKFMPAAYAYTPIVQKREGLDVFHTSFEELYPYRNLDSVSVNDYMYSPVLVKTVNEIYIAVTESDLDDYPGLFLQGSGKEMLEGAFAAYPLEEKIVEGEYPELVVSKRAGYLAKTKGARNFH